VEWRPCGYVYRRTRPWGVPRPDRVRPQLLRVAEPERREPRRRGRDPGAPRGRPRRAARRRPDRRPRGRALVRGSVSPAGRDGVRPLARGAARAVPSGRDPRPQPLPELRAVHNKFGSMDEITIRHLIILAFKKMATLNMEHQMNWLHLFLLRPIIATPITLRQMHQCMHFII